MLKSDSGTRVFSSPRALESIPLPSTGDTPWTFLTKHVADRISGTDNLNYFFSHLFKFVGVATAAVSCIVVVRQDEMREWAYHIQALSGEYQGITDDTSHVAVGKCIPNQWLDGSMSSTVLIPCNLLLRAVRDFRVTSSDAMNFEVNNSGLLALHCIAHELGHCRDYYERKPPTPIRLNEYRFHTVREVGYYYGGVILEEFFACYHSAPVVTSEVAETCKRTATDRAAKSLARAESWEAARTGKVWYARHTGLVTMSQEAIWVSLLAEAELLAYGIRGCVPIEVGSAILHHLPIRDRTEIGNALLYTLKAVILTYPIIPYDSVINVLSRIWKSLCYRLNIMTETEWNSML